MARVETAQDATEIAVGFLREYFRYVMPVKAAREDDVWVVQLDVGAFKARIATVRVDAESGGILDYTVPTQ